VRGAVDVVPTPEILQQMIKTNTKNQNFLQEKAVEATKQERERQKGF
jgi:hypothetical protein